MHDNWIWDNWRAGAWLLSVPDFLVSPEGTITPGGSCKSDPRVNPTLSTSCGNRYYDNQLGRVPRGFRPFDALYGFGNNVGPTRGVAKNGVDFWWDEGGLGTVSGNCWYNNVGSDGTLAGVTGSGVGDGNDSLPTDCTSTRGGDGVKLSYLLSCFMAREGDLPPEQCDWYTLPPQPGSPAASAKQKGSRRARASSSRRRAPSSSRTRSTRSRASPTRSPRSRPVRTGSGEGGRRPSSPRCCWRHAGGLRAGREEGQAGGRCARRARSRRSPSAGTGTAATAHERLATIEDIREQVNLKDSAVQTPGAVRQGRVPRARQHLQRPYAGTFRLYKLYARADSFAPFAED